MSVAPAGRTGSSPAGASIAWPVTADHGPRAPRPDGWAAVTTLVGGAAALGQLFLSWNSMVAGVGLRDADGSVTGWDQYQAARTGSAVSLSDSVTAYSVVGTALAGAALMLLGLAMLAPIDHRPLGIVALVLSVGALGSALWWLVRGHDTFSQTAADLFAHAGVGWYLFLVAGAIGVVGALKALATG